MNEAEARSVLTAELAKYRTWGYRKLVELMNKRLDYPVAAPSGLSYQVEVNAFWDDPDKPNGDLRVTGAVDDGGVSAFMPLCESFIIALDGTFVDEPSLDSLYRLLEQASNRLSNAAHQIRDLPLEPKKQHLHRIGKALAEIFDIQYHVFALKPDLTPHIFHGPFENPQGALTVALRHAHAAEQEEALEVAIAILEWAATKVSGTEYEKQARVEIDRLKSKRAQ